MNRYDMKINQKNKIWLIFLFAMAKLIEMETTEQNKVALHLLNSISKKIMIKLYSFIIENSK
jgi:hypothetical protein